MLLRHNKEPNEFRHRAGERRITVQRLGSYYKIRFTRYGVRYIRTRIYSLTEDQYSRLTTVYGRLINHSRLISEYQIVPHRRHFTAHVATHRHLTRCVVEYPNGVQTDAKELTKTELSNLQQSAYSKPNWTMVYDQQNLRWLYTTLLI